MAMSRVEHILKYILGEEETLPGSLSRVEELLVAVGKLIQDGSVKNPIVIKGTVKSFYDLPPNAEEGWFYFVGPDLNGDFEEYIYTNTGKWEFVGSNGVDTGYIDKNLKSLQDQIDELSKTVKDAAPQKTTYTKDEIDKKLDTYVPHTITISTNVENLKEILTSGFYRISRSRSVYEDYPEEGDFRGYDQLIVSRGGDTAVQILTSYYNPGVLAIRSAFGIGGENIKWNGWYVYKSADNFVKHSDIATATKPGIVKPNPTYGTAMAGYDSSVIIINKAGESEIRDGTNDFHPLVPSSISTVMECYGIDSKTQISEMQTQSALDRSSIGMQKKNLLKITMKHTSMTGVNFSLSDDHGIALSGAPEITPTYAFVGYMSLKKGVKYKLTGTPSDANQVGSNNIRLSFIRDGGELGGSIDSGHGAVYTPNENMTVGVRIRCGAGDDVEGLIFYPMVRYAEITDDTYEPYCPSLQEQIDENAASLNGHSFWSGTKSEYDLLGTYDDKTLYMISG